MTTVTPASRVRTRTRKGTGKHRNLVKPEIDLVRRCFWFDLAALRLTNHPRLDRV